MLEVEQRKDIEQFVDEALAKQSDGASYTRLIEHHVRVTDECPFKHKARRMSEAVLTEAPRTVEKWREDDVIEPSGSLKPCLLASPMRLLHFVV